MPSNRPRGKDRIRSTRIKFALIHRRTPSASDNRGTVIYCTHVVELAPAFSRAAVQLRNATFLSSSTEATLPSIRIIAAVGALVAATAPAAAQDWPTRPVTMVVPFAAGGAFDVMGRVFTPRMSESLGQQVIVENIGAAAGIVGTNRVAKAVPDGYTFLLGSVGTHAYNATLYKKLPYNPASDFAPVALFAEQPMVLITRKDFPANNLQEFIAYAKANGAKLQYGSAGTVPRPISVAHCSTRQPASIRRTFPIAAADRRCWI